MIKNKGGNLSFEDLISATSDIIASGEQDGKLLDLNAVISLHIRKALKLSKGKIHGPDGVAELIGINPNTFRAKMKKLGIPYMLYK